MLQLSLVYSTVNVAGKSSRVLGLVSNTTLPIIVCDPGDKFTGDPPLKSYGAVESEESRFACVVSESMYHLTFMIGEVGTIGVSNT